MRGRRIRHCCFVIPSSSSFVIRHSILFIAFALAPRWRRNLRHLLLLPLRLTPTPTPSSPPARMRVLRFALPPLDGTISLGIYDARVSSCASFIAKTLSMISRPGMMRSKRFGTEPTMTGNPLPNGKYSARGFVVGDLKVEGVDYFFNDWVTDEKSPHIRSLDSALDGQRRTCRSMPNWPAAEKTAFVCDPKTGAILKRTVPDRRRALQASRDARECGRRDRLRNGQGRNDLVRRRSRAAAGRGRSSN